MFNLQRWKRAHSLLLANQKGSKGQHISGQNILGQNISGQKQTIFKNEIKCTSGSWKTLARTGGCSPHNRCWTDQSPPSSSMWFQSAFGRPSCLQKCFYSAAWTPRSCSEYTWKISFRFYLIYWEAFNLTNLTLSKMNHICIYVKSGLRLCPK